MAINNMSCFCRICIVAGFIVSVGKSQTSLRWGDIDITTIAARTPTDPVVRLATVGHGAIGIANTLSAMSRFGFVVLSPLHLFYDAPVAFVHDPFELSAEASETEFRAALDLILAGINSAGHYVGPYAAIINLVQAAYIPAVLPELAEVSNMVMIDCAIEDLIVPWRSPGWAVSLLTKQSDGARPVVRHAKTLGLSTTLVVSSVLDTVLRKQALAAIQASMDEGMLILSPSLSWCEDAKAFTQNCRTVVTGGKTICQCIAPSEELQWFTSLHASLYEVNESSLPGGLDGTPATEGSQRSLHSTNPDTISFAAGIISDASRTGAVVDVYVNLVIDYAAFHHALYQVEIETLERGESWHQPTFVAGWYNELQAGFLHRLPWLNGSVVELGSGGWRHTLNETIEHHVMLIGSFTTAVNPSPNKGHFVKILPLRWVQFMLSRFGGSATRQQLCAYDVLATTREKFDFAIRWSSTTMSYNRLQLTNLGLSRFEDIFGGRIWDGNGSNIAGTPVQQVVSNEGVQSPVVVLPAENALHPIQTKIRSWSALYGCLPGHYNYEGFVCEPCPTGRVAPIGAPGALTLNAQTLPELEEVCEPCKQGYVAETVGLSECSPCPAGRYWSNGVCHKCDVGSFQDMNGRTTCQKCLIGRFANVEGQHRCHECQPGRFAIDGGSSSCLPCPAGTFSDSNGASECTNCGVGSYVEELGSTSCIECAENLLAGSTTLQDGSFSRFLCVCPPGTWDPRAYHSVDARGDANVPEPQLSNTKCVPCDAYALDCPGYSQPVCPLDTVGIPWFSCFSTNMADQNKNRSGRVLLTPVYLPMETLKKLHYSKRLLAEYVFNNATGRQQLEVSDRLDLAGFGILKCETAEACPGQPVQQPWADPCGRHHEGLSCGHCADGFAQDHSGGCARCRHGKAETLVVCIIIVIFAVAGCACYSWNQISQSQEALTQAFSSPVFFVSMWSLQFMGLLKSFAIIWPAAIMRIVTLSRVMLLSMDPLQFACLSGKTTFAAAYFFRQSILVTLLVAILSWWFISKVVSWIGGGKPRPVDLQALANSTGVLFEWAFLAICSVSLEMFVCMKAPGGKSNIKNYPYVVCYEEIWATMLPYSIMFVCLYAVGIYSSFAAICLMAPAFLRNFRFWSMTRFITQQVHPSVWWYHMVILTRFLVLVLIPVIAQHGHTQMVMSTAVLLLSLWIHLTLEPFITRAANRLETMSLTVFIVILALSSYFIYHGGNDFDTKLLVPVLQTCMAVIVTATALCSAWMAFAAVKPERYRLYRQAKIRSIMPGIRSMAAVLAAASDDKVVAMLDSISYVDIWHCDMVVRFTLTELFGLQSSNYSSGTRLSTKSTQAVSDDKIKSVLAESKKALTRSLSSVSSGHSSGSASVPTSFVKGSIVWV